MRQSSASRSLFYTTFDHKGSWLISSIGASSYAGVAKSVYAPDSKSGGLKYLITFQTPIHGTFDLRRRTAMRGVPTLKSHVDL
jgi:hypothetical protein